MAAQSSRNSSATARAGANASRRSARVSGTTDVDASPVTAFGPAFVTAIVGGLVAAWVGFAGTIVWTMARGRASFARVLHVGLHATAIAVTLRWPTWGTAISAGMHGLEYYFLSARMIGPAEGESSRIRGPWVWVSMAVAMAPAFVVGALIAPFKSTFALSTTAADYVEIGRLALNAVVLTHYFADAFIYRFRIPSVRRVALRRLHFA